MIRASNLIALLVLLLVAGFSLATGRLGIDTWAIPAALLDFSSGSTAHFVLWDVRLPRIILAALAGGALALSGATLQGVFQNVLVDPHIIGVTAGAAFGGTLAILLGLGTVGLMGSALLWGLLALALVYGMATLVARQNRLMLILFGMILSGMFSALVRLLQYLSDAEDKLPNIVFWLMGSFSEADWHKVAVLAVPVIIGGGLLLALRWRINILSLGDKDAMALGTSVTGLRWAVLFLTAWLTASQVAVSGGIGWVGLVIPHLARLVVGADHKRLLPMALIMGATFMILVDDLARTLSASEIPLGILTALVGAPIFTVLLIRNRRNFSR